MTTSTYEIRKEVGPLWSRAMAPGIGPCRVLNVGFYWVGEATIMRTVKHGCLARRLIPRLRCAAPAISSETASEAVSWIVCSAVAANGVHGPCEWYDASRLALRASWSSRWLAAPNRLHCKSTLCTDALLYSCTSLQRWALCPSLAPWFRCLAPGE